VGSDTVLEQKKYRPEGKKIELHRRFSWLK
jgi:hypothetical protein